MGRYPTRLTLKTYGEDVLRAPTKNIEIFDEELTELSEKMILLMEKSKGIGLAAPQVGISERIVVLKVDNPHEDEDAPQVPFTPMEALLYPMMPATLVNPKIIAYGDETNDYEEGCLSIPKTYGTVTRPKTIMVTAQLLDGKQVTLECGGFLARVIQHELDHLEGLLFTDRMTLELKAEIEPRLLKMTAEKKNKFLLRLLRGK